MALVDQRYVVGVEIGGEKPGSGVGDGRSLLAD
jgi:hypothetical protein